MVLINESVTCITENDINVGDFVRTDFSDSVFKVYAVEDDQVMTNGLDGTFWIDIAYIVSVEKNAFNNIKKDDKKMAEITVRLEESQIEELVQNVDIIDYVDYMHMIDWNDYMSSTPATEIIDSVDTSQFDTSDEYAVLDGHGRWVSSDSLEEILEPFLEEMMQDYIDNNL